MLEIGTRFAVVMEVTRFAESGEKIKMDDGTEMEITNYLRNKFWARLSNGDKKSEVLCSCESGEDDFFRLAVECAEKLDGFWQQRKSAPQK